VVGDPGTEDFTTTLPKAEIHLHLEGAIDLETIVWLRRQRGERDEGDLRLRLAGLYSHRDFVHFLQNYRSLCAELRRPEDFATVVAALCARLARDSVRFAEVMCSPMIFTRQGMPIGEIMGAVSEAARLGEKEHGVVLRFLFDGVRQWGIGAFEELVTMAVDCRRAGVIGVGVGGDERSLPTAAFGATMREARRLGLHTVIHAGEFDGPRSVWEAIDELEVERVGHGIRAVEDDVLVKTLARRGIPLECCPTSNIRTGVVRSWADHPIPKLHQAGVRVTINSDDPALFGTTLSEEWQLLVSRLGLSRRDVVQIGLQTVEAAFLEPNARRRLADELRSAALRQGVSA
jgi:adenosine deaminase